MAGPTAELASLVGRTLGHYRILEMIGAGGMGQVYRAHDDHLDCDVAIKVLPPGSVSDESARKQFQKEARALARLNHPNIAIVHHFDTQQGVDYLVMEYIRGTTLSQKLVAGKLPEKEVVRLGTQLAEGLRAAHEHGVVHSDLKPGNLRLTDDGRLKILDFGLAKLRLPPTATATTASFSEAHSVAGTLPYMAPEQLLAGEVDARTDIHGAGCVLYEMITGKRTFPQVEPSKLISAILNSTPLSPAAINPGLSAELERIIGKCLEKEPDNRYQSAKELAIDLRRLHATQTNLHDTGFLLDAGRQRPTSLSWRMLLALAGVALVVLVSVAYWLARPLPRPRILSGTQITNDRRDKFVAFTSGEGASSPLLTDGGRLYFEEARPRAAIVQVSTTGGETAGITSEFPSPLLMDVSPSGSKLLVGANRADREPFLEVLPLPAGPRSRVGNLRGHDGAWSPDERSVVYCLGADLYVARSDGTQSQKIVGTAGVTFWPRWSPEGTRIRFTVKDTETGAESLWEVNRDGTGVHLLLPGWNTPPAECCGNWTPDGKFFVFQSTHDHSTSIWALREGHSFFRQTGFAPVLLTPGAMNYFRPVVSRDGKQIFVIGAVPRGEAVRYDRGSREFLPYLTGISADDLDFSRDGKWVTYVEYPAGTLWRSRVDGAQRVQLTFSPMQVFLPRWSPDGKRIAFAAKLPGSRWHIYLISGEGGLPRRITNGEGDEGDVGWSPDGTSLVFGYLNTLASNVSIHLLDLKHSRLSSVPESKGLYAPRWSPDGRYLSAYSVDQNKLLLYDFQEKKWVGWPVTNPGFPNWSRDSRYIYFDTLVPGGPDFVRMRITDGRVEKVADLKNVRRVSSSFGEWSGLGPDDSPLVVRDTGTQEIYALQWQIR